MFNCKIIFYNLKLITTVMFVTSFLFVSNLNSVFAADKTKKKANQDSLSDLKYVEGDEQGNEVRALKTELLISASEEKAISQIKKVIKKYKNTPLEPDLMFRLSELYMRRAKSNLFFELTKKSEDYVSMAPTQIKTGSSVKSIKQAIDIYEEIQRRFKNYGQMDIVLFNNGFARQQIGQISESEKRYKLLIKLFPQSSLVPDCHLAIGEMAFDSKNFKLALEHFNSIKNFPDSRVYPYGLYKAGWTYYNLRNALAGLKELENVVEYGRFVVKNGIDARLDLRKEALSDMALFYEDVYAPEKAWSYFSSQAQEIDPTPYLLKLSSLYKRHSRFGDIVILSKDFIKNLPLSEGRPKVHEDLILAYNSLNDINSSVNEMESFFKVCDLKSSWSKEQQKNIEAKNVEIKKIVENKDNKMLVQQEVRSECQLKLDEVSLKLASSWYKSWRNKKSDTYAFGSEKSFEIYLRRAPLDETANKARYNYAELYYLRDIFRSASANYAIVGRATTDKELSHESLYSSIVSLQKAIESESKKSKNNSEIWNDEDEKLFANLVSDYERLHSKGKYLLDVKFKRALIAYEKSKYDIASPILLTLGNQFSKEEKGIKSQDLYLDILNIQKKYVDLKKYASNLRENEKDKTRLVKLTKIFEEAYFMSVQTIEESGQHAEAINQYREFAKSNITSPLAEQAWWNSIQLQFKVKKLIDAANASIEFEKLFPNSNRVVESLIKAAHTFEELSIPENAVPVLKRLKIVDGKQSSKWMMLLGDYQSISGDEVGAIKTYEELKKSSDKKISEHAYSQLEILSRDKKGTNYRKKLIAEIIKNGGDRLSSLAQLEILEEIYQSGDLSSAFSESMKILSKGKTADNYALARARFIQADILEKEFEKQSVKAQIDRIAIVLSLKAEKLDKAQQAYQSAIRYGDPKITIQSMENLSRLYRNYVKSLREMPLPGGLEQAEESAFRNEMEKLAIPLEEKSIDTLLQAKEAAKKLELLDGSIGRIQSKIDELNFVKVEYPKVELVKPRVVLPRIVSGGGV